MKSLHLSPSGALIKGWELTKKHFIVMLGLVLGYMVLLWVISLLSGTDTTTFRYWILYLVNLVLSVWVNAGFAKILLNAYDGEEPSFSVFKELFPKLGGLIGVNVIVAVCYCIPVVLGFIVLFIGAGASAVSFNLADPYSFGHFMGQAFGGVTGILFLVLLLVSFYIALRLMFAVYAYVEDSSIGVLDDDTGKHVDYPSLYFDDYRSEFIRARSFDYRCIRNYDYHYVHDGSYVSPD